MLCVCSAREKKLAKEAKKGAAAAAAGGSGEAAKAEADGEGKVGVSLDKRLVPAC